MECAQPLNFQMKKNARNKIQKKTLQEQQIREINQLGRLGWYTLAVVLNRKDIFMGCYCMAVGLGGFLCVTLGLPVNFVNT